MKTRSSRESVAQLAKNYDELIKELKTLWKNLPKEYIGNPMAANIVYRIAVSQSIKDTWQQ